MIWVWLLGWQLAWTQPGHGVSRDLFPRPSARWIVSPDADADAKDSYFGFSVAYAPISKRLIVSAPQHDEVGEVYSCDLDSSLNCKGIPKSPNLKKFETYKDKQWFGAVVKAGESFFVACTSRTIERRKFTDKYGNVTNLPGTFGRCYKYPDDDKNIPEYLKSLTEAQRHSPKEFISLYEHTMDSFGWSLDINGDDIMIGGPAMFTGRAMKYIDNSHDPISMTGYRGQDRLVQYNYGYSIVSGNFVTKPEKPLIYAIGSPYGELGYGKVLFYEKKTKTMGYAEVLETKDENAVGSLFSAAMCAARLTNGSSATALLVAAPGSANSTLYEYNRGAVYFYKPSNQLPLKNYYVKIIGEKDNSYFGSAVMSVGDFNGDGLDEIAISAPYEDGTGAVYIYSSNDLRTDRFEDDDDATKKPKSIRYMQRITPEFGPVLTASINSFGLSLATRKNDEKGCNELAIGAPESNKVLVLSCIAFVTVKLQEPTLIPIKISTTTEFKEFTLRSCFKVEFPEKPKVITTKIKVVVDLSHHNAKLKTADTEYEIALDKNELEHCNDVKLSAPLMGNYEFPVKCTITASEVVPAVERVDPSRVALSDYSVLHLTKDIWLTKECKNREHCVPHLALDHISVPERYMTGSSHTIGLDMSVVNQGEVAFSACVRIFLNNTDVVAVPGGCERDDANPAALLCRPSFPLRTKPWLLPIISLQTSHLTSDDKSIEISSELYNRCDQEPTSVHNKTISLVVDQDIFIKGITDSGQDHNVNMTKEDVDGKQFVHSYTISNIGMTKWVNVEATLVTQTRSFIEYSPIIIVSTSRDGGKQTTSNCVVIPAEDNAGNVTYICKIEQIYKEPVKVTVPMSIMYGKLEAAVDMELNTQFTSLTLDLHGVKIKTSETSTLNYIDNRVAIWIIVVASIVGLLILVLLCIVLTRCGFFKRDKKQKLERVRHSVRRQTIMRRTGDGQAPMPTDRQSLIGDVPEQSAAEAAANDHRLRLDSNATKKKK